jgi:hypothetical protein
MSSVCPNANTGNSSRASQSVRSIQGASGREIQEMGQGRRLLALHRLTIRSNASFSRKIRESQSQTNVCHSSYDCVLVSFPQPCACVCLASVVCKRQWTLTSDSTLNFRPRHPWLQVPMRVTPHITQPYPGPLVFCDPALVFFDSWVFLKRLGLPLLTLILLGPQPCFCYAQPIF